MTLVVVGLMGAGALVTWLFRSRRAGVLLVFSIGAVYLLQPRGFEMALPTATVLLVVAVWWLTRTSTSISIDRNDTRTLLLITVTVGLSVLARAWIDRSATDNFEYQTANLILQGIRTFPPMIALAVATFAAGSMVRTSDDTARRRIAIALILVIVVLLVVLKLPALHNAASGALTNAAQPVYLDWQWIGFSYIAFRLLHVLLDYRNERLRPVSLRDFALYVMFFPALAAGPIDRVEHFVRELALPVALDRDRVISGGTRIGVGLFKKFVLADSLARIALSVPLVEQAVRGTPWSLWLMLYAYSFQIFLDFSGYSDIAIGIGILAGIKLPENFSAPYLKPTITAFWNSWHITLSTWFRTYFFTPVSRTLMGTRLRSQRLLIILIAQVGTMVLIGLWHGIALNFVLWGLWHGLGLWLHRWASDHLQGWHRYTQARPRLDKAVYILSVVGTFHFVALGWVFFALPDVQHIGLAFAKLAGLNG